MIHDKRLAYYFIFFNVCGYYFKYSQGKFMKCDYCNAEIAQGSEIIVNGRYFCSPLHRYSWQKENTGAGPASTAKGTKTVKAAKPSNIKMTPAKIFALIGIIIGMALGPSLGKYTADYFLANKVDREIAADANEVNKLCPYMVDSETRLDNTAALPGNKFVYNYTLVNVSRSNFDTLKVQEVLRPQIIDKYKNNPKLKLFRDKKLRVINTYKDKDGFYVMQVVINPEDY